MTLSKRFVVKSKYLLNYASHMPTYVRVMFNTQPGEHSENVESNFKYSLFRL